jgi:hypothetical protein
MHPYMWQLIDQQHMADLRRQADERRLAKTCDDTSQVGTSRRVGSPWRLQVRALVRGRAAA